jgi:hypothetical protein
VVVGVAGVSRVAEVAGVARVAKAVGVGGIVGVGVVSKGVDGRFEPRSSSSSTDRESPKNCNRS